MKRVRGYHLLFGAALLLLGALGSWWTIFFLRSVELEKTAQLNRLIHATVVTALMLGHRDEPPAPGPVEGPEPLEIVETSVPDRGELFAPLVPNHPQLGVRPTAASVQAVEAKVHRRRLMLIGEGGLLLILLAVCTFMLYRLIRQERRHMRRMEDFVSAVTHEMKTPLAGIKSMLQTFAAHRVPEAEKERLWSLGLKETERLEHMVENILISGRIRGGRLEVHTEPVDLRSFLDGFLDHRRRYLVERPDALRLAWEIDDGRAVVDCDPRALRIVLENLTDNAFKYGGPAPQVTLRVRRTAGRLQLSVEDQGIGFPPERAEELFVPFRRAMEVKSSVQHGTGLGLSIARELVRRMGGGISAVSDGPGKGSRFICSLREVQA